jgi:hypothetical protein
MKKLLISLAFAAAFAAPVHAQTAAPAAPAVATAESTAAARELLAAMNYRQMMANMAVTMNQSMPAMMKQSAMEMLNRKPGLSAEQKAAELAKIDKELPRFAKTMSGTLSDPAFIDQMLEISVGIYARHYTAEEIRQITAFYRSPVGAKTLATMPAVMQEAMQATQRIMLPRIVKATEQLVAEAAK